MRLPLSTIASLEFLGRDERRLVSHIQGRTYANIFGLVERYIGAKVLEISRDHWLGDQHALEALVRFTDEEIKHQELFRRVESMVAESMPAGYTFLPQPNDVASAVLAKCTWAVLALTCHIELFTQAHYRQSIEPDAELSEVWKDVFLFHWKEESQHAILDELEWKREDAKLSVEQRDSAVTDLKCLQLPKHLSLARSMECRERVNYPAQSLVRHERGRLCCTEPADFPVLLLRPPLELTLHQQREHPHLAWHGATFIIHDLFIDEGPDGFARNRPADASLLVRLACGCLGRVHTFHRPALWDDPASRRPRRDEQYLQRALFGESIRQRTVLEPECPVFPW